MSSVTSPPSTVHTYRVTTRLLGAFNALVGLGLSVITAFALSDLAHRRLGSGLWQLVGVLAVRWTANFLGDEWTDRAARVIRTQWRSRFVDHFRQPQREGARGRGDLALAVERASLAPALSVLETSARVSMLGLVVVFWAAGWLSTLIIVVLLALAVPFYQRAGTRSAALEDEYQQRRALLESRQLELLHHAPELRALGAVAYGANEIGAISDSEHAIALRAIRVALESSLVTEFLSGVSIGLVAMVVGFALLGGRITLTHALIAVLATSELFTFVRRYGSEFHRREDAASSLDLLSEVRASAETSTSDSLVRAIDLETTASATPLNLDLRPTSRTLVTGPSGSGKTTLLDTLLGWREPRAGTVARTSSRVGHVSAESELFAGSLWDNVTLGADLDEHHVRQLLADLGLSGARFEDLTAPLLADGRGLSSGERVRLVLARCLLADPVLLVIDDVAGVLDGSARDAVTHVLDRHPQLAIIEATVDTPLLHDTLVRIEIHP